MHLREKTRRPLVSRSFGRLLRLPENRAARMACARLAKALRLNRRLPTPLIYLHGSPGTGKSHLAELLIEQVNQECPDQTTQRVSARDLGRLASGQTVDEEKRLRKLRRTRLLVIEDMQHLPLSAAAALTTLLDERIARRRLTLVTASMGPTMLPDFPPRLSSRLSAGLVVRLKPLALSSLLRLARMQCRERELRLQEETLAWLIERSQSSVRSLLGDLGRLQQMCYPRLPIDLETARQVLASEAAGEATSLQAIAERVAKWFHLAVHVLQSRDRRPTILWPRQVAMFVARQTMKWSLADIGLFFGGCDHTTVMHAVRKVIERMKQDSTLSREIEELRS